MGTLTNGKFTYGNKTEAQILALTDMKAGDTVFNTTYNYIDVFTGTRWVNPHMAESYWNSANSRSYNGDVLRPSTNINLATNVATSTADDECIIGVVARETFETGTTHCVAYVGLYQVNFVATTIPTTQQWKLSKTQGFATVGTSSAVGMSGPILSAHTYSTPFLAWALIRPTEKF